MHIHLTGCFIFGIISAYLLNGNHAVLTLSDGEEKSFFLQPDIPLGKYINGDFNEIELKNWYNLFTEKHELLTNTEKIEFLKKYELVLSSDAFFPFRDNIDNANKYNVKYIINPGGSINDYNIIEACNDYNIYMAISGKRLFLH